MLLSLSQRLFGLSPIQTLLKAQECGLSWIPFSSHKWFIANPTSEGASENGLRLLSGWVDWYTHQRSGLVYIVESISVSL
jgi:hypothetical protein